MNYLGHAFLSFGDPDLLAGNMISDFVKGKKQFDYPARVFAGIKLHRAIDTFTDAHEALAAFKNVFRDDYRLYAAPVSDVVIDHFLANDPTAFADAPALFAFTQETYRSLGDCTVLPEKFAAMLPYMREQNWLYNYRFPEGLQKSLGGLHRRAAAMPAPDKAFELTMMNRKLLQECYDAFFPAVRAFTARQSAQLLSS